MKDNEHKLAKDPNPVDMGAYANNYKQKVHRIVNSLYPEDFKHPKNFDTITKLQIIALLQLIGEELAHINDNLVSKENHTYGNIRE